VAALALLLLIVPSGALVRLTASGLGCPEWPQCEGSALPPLTGHGAIEFGNRIFSAVVMAVAVLAWLVGRRLPGRPRGIRLWSGVMAVTTVAQVPLGGVTVYTELHPLMVAAHFLLSMVTIGCAILLVFHAHDRAHSVRRATNRRHGPFAALTAAAFAGVLVTGSLVTASGPHSGDRLVTRRIWAIDEAAFVHVRAAAVFLVLGAILAAWLWHERAAGPLTRRLALLAVPVIALQITIGEYQYRNALPWEVVAVHVTLAAAAWALVAAIAYSIARPPTRA
jgi:cytochrome c oxidase assembly protein subunit 15